MRIRTSFASFLAVLTVGLTMSTCGVSADAIGSAAGGTLKGLRFLVPNSPGLCQPHT